MILGILESLETVALTRRPGNSGSAVNNNARGHAGIAKDCMNSRRSVNSVSSRIVRIL